MQYRNATVKDIPGISELQQLYHISTIRDEDKADGFVTTLFTHDHFREMIEKESGLAIACADERVVAYAMAASWQYWTPWPLFQYMINELPRTVYLGRALSLDNSYQYGPICIHRSFRGTGVLANLFEFSREQMEHRFPILITFINQANPRSFRAHTRLGLDVIKTFAFNNNEYYLLGYDTAKKIPMH